MAEKKKGAKDEGIRLQSYNFSVMMIIGTVILCICLFYTTVAVSQKYEGMMQATDEYIRWNENAATVHEASEYLTEEARLFVQTADRQHMENYFMEIYINQRRKLVLEEIRDYYADAETAVELEQAIYESGRLMEREYQAMKLVCIGAEIPEIYIPPEIAETALSAEDAALSAEEMIEKGRTLLYDKTYQEAKESIYAHLETFVAQTLAQEEQEREDSVDYFFGAIYAQRMVAGALVILSLTTLIVMLRMIAIPLQRCCSRIRERAMLDEDGVEELRELVCVYNEMYAARGAEAAVFQYQPENDPLTGVMHRGTYQEIAEALEENAEPMTFVICRVDHFAELAANHSPETLDWMLKKTAALLAERAEWKDHIFRVDRAEFAVIFMNTREDSAEELAAFFHKINERTLLSEDGLPPFSLSAGAAFSQKGWQKVLSAKAREALLQARKRGEAEIAFYED